MKAIGKLLKLIIMLFGIIFIVALIGIFTTKQPVKQAVIETVNEIKAETPVVPTKAKEEEVKSEVPKEFISALKKAKNYSDVTYLSKKGIYKQLTSDFEQFSKEAAQYSIDNVDADFKQNALKKAISYRDTVNMSKKAIYDQLLSQFEEFTKEEAQFAIDNLDK